MRKLWLLIAACAATLLGLDDARAADRSAQGGSEHARVAATGEQAGRAENDGSQATPTRIQQLIGQLGNPRYALRRAAANELRQIGAEAFDMLNAATNDVDPEVAASARYLLRQITVRWVRRGDSSSVRALLRDYGEQRDEMRLARVEALSALPNGEGVAALCRIARFDRSSMISRRAALAIIQPGETRRRRTLIDPELVEQELGNSRRVASVWLRQFLMQIRDPAASLAEWRPLVDDEAARLNENEDDTSSEIVVGLLWNLADLHRELGHKNELIATADRMMELDATASEDMAIQLLSWFSEHASWNALDEFLAKHEAALQSKRPLYHAAIARARQGKNEEGEKLAERAAALDPQATLEGFIAARDLEEHSRFDWAVREYQQAIEREPIASHSAILARVYLANLLHDYEKHERAADVLEPLAKAVQSKGNVSQLYKKLIEYYEDRLALPEVEGLSARMHYFRACHYHDQREWKREREQLEYAIRFDPTDADVVIAMYRLPEADSEFRESVRKRIGELARQFQKQIDQNPDYPAPYNQWAWLISNTEGDYRQAIEYSHRSLELIPAGAGESAGASFLDTLGRCYYAAGDYENAVKYQRQAVEKVDYMQVMQRQLALFEKALAEQNAEAAATGTSN